MTPAPRWAVWAAYAVPLCLLPSVIWRLATATTLPGGWYLALLSGLELGAGLLTLGLVHRWGEVLPGWVPWLGSREIPVRPVIVAASLGATAVLTLTAFGVLNRIFALTTPTTIEEAERLSSFDVPTDADVSGAADWVAWLYLPTIAWGPLLAAVAWAYYRRRTAGTLAER